MAQVPHDLADREDLVRGVTVLLELTVHPQPHVQRLRVRDLVGGDQPGAERGEGLAVLALVPGAAPLVLEGALGDVVRQHVAADVREALLGGAQVAGRGADDDAELGLPVGLHAAARDQHGVVRADHGVRGLEEDDGLRRSLRADLGRVPVVVQPDAHDLADPADRGADAQPFRVQGRELAGRRGVPYAGQYGVVGEQGPVHIRDQAGQVAQGPVLVEQRGALRSGRSDTQQLHGHSPVVEGGRPMGMPRAGRWVAAIGGLADPPRWPTNPQDPVHRLERALQRPPRTAGRAAIRGPTRGPTRRRHLSGRLGGAVLAVLQPGPFRDGPRRGGQQVQPGRQRHHGGRDQRPERQQGQYAAHLAHRGLLLGTQRGRRPGATQAGPRPGPARTALQPARTALHPAGHGLAPARTGHRQDRHRGRGRGRGGPPPAHRAPRGHHPDGGEQPQEHQPPRPERPALPEGVGPPGSERGGEQPVPQQLVGRTGHLRGGERPVHHEEHRQLQQRRQAAGHGRRPAEGGTAQGVQGEPYEHGEQHDRGSGRGLGQYRLHEPPSSATRWVKTDTRALRGVSSNVEEGAFRRDDPRGATTVISEQKAREVLRAPTRPS